MADGFLKSPWIQVPLLLASAFALERSADVFLDSLKSLSSRFNIDEALIALLTAGAEWEELAVILSSMSAGHQNLAYSNLLGSCIANILGGLGLGLVFLPPGLEYDSSTKIFTSAQLGVTALASVILLFATKLDMMLCALLFFGIFVLYVVVTLRLIWTGKVDAPEDSDEDTESGSDSGDEVEVSSRDGVPRDTNETSALLENGNRTTKRRSLAWLAIIMLLSAGVLSLSSYLITTSLVILCDKLHLTESTAGLTILSFITTIPEKAVAIKAGRRAQAGVITASTAGSNIFLLTLCLGVIFSYPASSELAIRQVEVGITLACSAALTSIVFLLPGSTRWVGSLLLLFYCAFLVYELIDAPR